MTTSPDRRRRSSKRRRPPHAKRAAEAAARLQVQRFVDRAHAEVDLLGNHPIASGEPLPEFTLGPDSNPTGTQLIDLCGCIWGGLGKWERETAIAYSEGRGEDVSTLNRLAFSGRFGEVLEECGGMEL